MNIYAKKVYGPNHIIPIMHHFRGTRKELEAILFLEYGEGTLRIQRNIATYTK